jgi:hypothetical protein
MKFFHVENANRTINAGPHSIRFAPYEMTGCWLGVYATENESEITELTALTRNPKTGVKEIDEQAYDHCIKKKRSASHSYSTSLANSTPTPGDHAPSAAGQPVDPNPPVPPASVEPLASVGAAIEVVPVQPKVK